MIDDRPSKRTDRTTNGEHDEHEYGEDDEYHCPACKKAFDSRDDLVKHMREQGLVD